MKNDMGWTIGDLAEYMRRLYNEAGLGLWQPENKEYEEYNQAYIFQYIAVRLLEKQKHIPTSNLSDYQRGYNAGYWAGKNKAKHAKDAV